MVQYNQENEQYQKDLAKYQTDLKKFNKDWAAYLAKNNIAMHGNVISSGMVNQGLKLDKESRAKVVFSNAQGTNNSNGWNLGNADQSGKTGFTYDMSGTKYLSWGKYPWTLTRRDAYGEASTQYAFVANSINEGNFSVTATFTNLQNSSYTDNDGNNHKITKIVEKYSTSGNSTDWPLLFINTDPTEGFWYMGVNPVSVTYQLFDENDNPITFENNAWITVSSLNVGPNATKGRREYVQGTNNISFYQLAGSSITDFGNGKMGSVFVNDNIRLKFNADNSVSYAILENHDLYSADGIPGGNFTKGDLLIRNYKNGQDGWINWDNSGEAGQYYGATVGLIAPGSNSYTMTYSSDVYGHEPELEGTYGYTWAMPSTTIPQTPFKEKKPTPPTKPNIEKPGSPTEKTTVVHYHYDVTTNRQKTRRCKLYSILRKYDDKLLKSVNK